MVGLPIEIDPEMGAGIDERAHRLADTHDHDGHILAVARDDVATPAALGDVVDPADHRQAAVPLSFRILVQLLSSIGMTDRRDWRTSASVASAGSALMVASVTGAFSGLTALTSTMPNLPVSSDGSGE